MMRVIVMSVLLSASLSWAGEYPATVTRVIDGDTIEVDATLGLRMHYHGPVRFLGFNAPELPTPAGLAAQRHLIRLFGMNTLVTIRTGQREFDKYGRVLGTIHQGHVDLIQEMIKAGQGVASTQ